MSFDILQPPEYKNKISENYRSLETILKDAFSQASIGKGKIRHAEDNQKFEDQIICVIGRLGLDFNRGQAIKKIIESSRFEKNDKLDYAETELLGAINYIASRIILIREKKLLKEDDI